MAKKEPGVWVKSREVCGLATEREGRWRPGGARWLAKKEPGVWVNSREGVG